LVDRRADRCQPHDKGIIDRVMNVQEIKRRTLTRWRRAGKIIRCQDETTPSFGRRADTIDARPRKLKVIYSPFACVGATAAVPVLE